MTVQRRTDGVPLVVHVIPSPRGRGAQRAARILVDHLDDPRRERHRLLGLFAGPADVPLDVSLGRPGQRGGAEGFRPVPALRLRHALRNLRPTAVVAHGGDAMKYVVPAVAGTGVPVAYCVIGTYAGSQALPQLWRWKRIMGRAVLVVAVGDEVLDECTGRFGVRRGRVVMIPNGRDPSLFHPGPEEKHGYPTLAFVGALTDAEAARSFRRGRGSPQGPTGAPSGP